jgi:ABC-type transporter Mla subunit MlaD
MDQPGNHILFRGNQPAAADRMRELLARTVQDQFADQRSNAGAIDDIRQRMEGLEWLVKEVREQEIPGMAAQLCGLARQFEESTQQPPRWAESLAEHIEVLRAQVAPVAELHSLWADLGNVSENVEHALPQLQAVCDTVGQALEALQAQDGRLAKLHQSVNKVQQSMESAAGRFSRLDKAVAELAQRTGQLDKELSAVKGRAEMSFSAGGQGGPERGDHHAPAHPVDGRDDGHGRRPVGQRGGCRQPGRPARRPGPGGARPDRAAR